MLPEAIIVTQPIYVLERFNIPAEGRYSPTEGEALAIAVALENSRYYTPGCPKLFIATDHKPLLGILGDRALDKINNPRHG